MAISNGVEITFDQTEELVKNIGELTRKQVMVGIPASTSARSGPISNAALGYIHEHGSPARNLPARPWLNPPISRLQERAAKMLARAASLASEGHMDEALKTLVHMGQLGANAVKQNVMAGGDPPFADWSESYKRKRGEAGQTTRSAATPHLPKNPNYTILVDTGEMVRAVTYVIRDRK